MAIVVVITVALLAMGSVTLRPKLAPIIVWPVLLMYPNAWWYDLNPLPMNIGFDDLFIIFSGVMVVIRRNMMEGIPPRYGWTMLMGFCMLAIVTLSNAMGLIRCPEPLLEIQIREVLKFGVFLILAYIILNTVDDMRDVRRVTIAFVVGITLSALLVIYTAYDLSAMRIFTSPFKLKEIEFAEATGELRATGALGEPNTVGLVMPMGLAMLIGLFRMASWKWKIALVGAALAMVLAVLLAKSRTGFTCLALIPVVLLFWRGMRKVGVAAILVGLLASVVMGRFFDQVLARFTEDLDIGTFGGRVEIWLAYLKSLDVLTLLGGQGQWAAVVSVSTRGKPHSGYLNLLCYYGIWGVLWGVALVVTFFRRAAVLRADPNDTAPFAIGRGCMMVMIIMLMYALTAETFSPNAWAMQLLLVVMALMQRTIAAAREQQACELQEQAWLDDSDYRPDLALGEGR